MWLWSKLREAERGTGMRECMYGAKRGKQGRVQGRVTPVRGHREGEREGCREDRMRLWGIRRTGGEGSR